MADELLRRGPLPARLGVCLDELRHRVPVQDQAMQHER